jgi:hypothetical protein
MDIELKYPDVFTNCLRRRMGRRTKYPYDYAAVPAAVIREIEARIDEYVRHIREGTKFERSNQSLAASRRR